MRVNGSWTHDEGGVTPLEQPRPLTPTAPIEEPAVFATTSISSISNGEVHAVPIRTRSEDDPSRIIVLSHYQGGKNSDAPHVAVTDFVPPLPHASPATHHHIEPRIQEHSRGFLQGTTMPSSYGTTMLLQQREHTTNWNRNTSPTDEGDDKTQMMASGVAGAVVGTMILGPYVGIVSGFYSAYATKNGSGATRDIAIALGDIALATRDKARIIDEKHHLVDKSKTLLWEGWLYAKELDRKYLVMAKVRDFIIFSWREVVSFSRQHRLLERGVVGVGRSFEWLYSKAVSSKPQLTPPTINYEDVPALPPARTH